MSKHVLSKHAAEAGPLALQMGNITGAVDDLVHGYEQLVHSLPNLTTQICNVHSDTEQMAKQLEHRTRSLVDGYEYLQGLSTQLPEMFRETASAHRTTLQEAISLMTPEDKEKIAEQEQVIAKILRELQSISHERVIMDVLTRPIINETKRIHAQARGASNQLSQKRYTTGIAGTSTQGIPGPSRNGTPGPSRGPVQGDSTVVINNSRQHTASVTTNVSYKDTFEHLTTPIHIPQYSPTIASVQSAQRSGTKQQPQSEYYTNTIELAVQQGGAPSLKDRHTRNTHNTTQVPNLRTGTIAAEVAGLLSVPTDAVSAAEMEERFRRRRTVKRTTKTKYVEKEPLAKSLAEKLGQTEEEVTLLKSRLSQASHHFDKDQSKAIKKLQILVEELRGQQSGNEKAILAAVEKMLQEAMAGKKKSQGRDAEILKALQSMLVAPKQVAMVEKLHEYKVLTARAKTPVTSRTVPVLMEVPAPPKAEKPKCVEVQTEPFPAPVVETPPVPAPVVQQIVQPPPQPVIVQVPAQSGVERELIELMQTVVTSQQQTMQGNQALILSLIHERNTRPEPVIPDDVSEISVDTPEPAPAPAAPVIERAPTPPPAEVPRAPSPPRYSTAFGSVVLSGDLMVGPYTIQPAIIPADQKPCLLRGIPLPSSRKRAPADYSGAIPNQREGSSDHVGAAAGGATEEAGASSAVSHGEVAQVTSTAIDAAEAAEAVTQTHDTPAPVLIKMPALTAGTLGLQGSGVSSTCGRGGSRQHTTPGVIEQVPVGSVPPHMRRIASAFTMRALSSAPDVPVEASTHVVVAAPAPAAADSAGGDMHILLRNLQILSGVPVAAPAAQVITPELLAQKVSEGVQRGVKEALGLMDTHNPHRTYYDATNRPSARHHSDPARRGLLSAEGGHSSQQDEVRHSLQLLKSRPVGGRKRGSPSAAESTDFSISDHSQGQGHQQCSANNIRSTYYSRLPHIASHTNEIRYNEGENRDVFQPPRRRELSSQQQQAEHNDVMKEMEFSRQQARQLLLLDENSSFNDSVSLDEETAAHLRDPLLYNNNKNMHQDDVSEMSSLDFGDGKNVRLVQRDEATRRQKDLFASQEGPQIRSDLPAHPSSSPPRANHTTTKRSAAVHHAGLGFAPLVSRVLAQSATEEALRDPRMFGARQPHDEDHRREERDLTESVENNMWDLDVTAPLVQRNSGNAAEASFDAESDDSSRSILSLSTKSSSDSSTGRDIQGLDDEQGGEGRQQEGVLLMADAPAAGRASDRIRGSAPALRSPVASSTDSSTTSSSEKSRPRQSLLPRYSTSRGAAPSQAPRRSGSRSRSKERTRFAGTNTRTSASDIDGQGVNTDRLAAQMMLNVLELHKPSNYTVQPYLANPISAHTKGRSVSAALKRSKFYAAESVESIKSSESESNSHHSDLNCTGSSISSDDGNLLDTVASKGGSAKLKLMGLGNSKLLTLRK